MPKFLGALHYTSTGAFMTISSFAVQQFIGMCDGIRAMLTIPVY
jgi:hypothetical protein